ncbi:DNA-binding transcriptional regulator, IclR family [Nocardioides scoriae]|uniref:DNA-binding transcriptional regulator, IclR family n=1 Tax=Nocardioides scoriae TaxID=642780 RepID=A0A1H1UPP8_9ACTN|nr:IclR family transcriptional regulator [Nocardioides scoriae]SDS73809.1 DNA-binding transcriptional regulator, IclR family [Nocardioides scoriae]
MTGRPEAIGASGTQAVDRAAALLTRVVEADAAVTFAELSESSGLARSTTSRLLAALERTRLVTRTAHGEYVGGPLFVLYAARHDRHQQLTRLAQPVLEEVGAATGETVHLAVDNGGRVEHVAQVDGTYLLGARDWNDVEVPLHCSALGKVLLAWKVLELPAGRLLQLTDQTITTRVDLEGDLEWARQRGYAVTHDELEVGLSGVAAPVFGPDDDVVAAVGVSGPTARLEARAEEIGQLLIDHTQALTRRLRPGSSTGSSTKGVR